MITFLTFIPLALAVITVFSIVSNLGLEDPLAIVSLITIPIAGIYLYYANPNALFYIYHKLFTLNFLRLTFYAYEY